MEEAHEVGVDVGVRVVDRVPHPGLGREVDDGTKAVGCEEGLHLAAVGEIDAGEGETVARFEALQTRLLESRVVVVVEVVEADNSPAFTEEALGEVVTDEAGGAGDENWLGFVVGHWDTSPIWSFEF
jgi:hypothetical protein